MQKFLSSINTLIIGSLAAFTGLYFNLDNQRMSHYEMLNAKFERSTFEAWASRAPIAVKTLPRIHRHPPQLDGPPEKFTAPKAKIPPDFA